jgi:hypothetical protein
MTPGDDPMPSSGPPPERTGHSSAECRGDAAAYALGALEPDEAEAFRRHLSGCVVCRDELAAFQHAADTLPGAVRQHRAPDTLRAGVLKAVREEAAESRTPGTNRHTARPTRRLMDRLIARPALALATVAAVVLIALVGVALVNRGSAARVVQASVGSAELRVSGGQAELIIRHLPAPPPGRIYELWLRRGNEPPAPTNTLFSVTRQDTAEVGVPGKVHAATVVMVTSEPAGGSLAPTSAPVVVARVA